MTATETRYETVIGLEVHVQLLTQSKMFCACRADYSDAQPNTHVCPVCLGMPGVLPVINQRAVEYTIATGLALNCTIPALSKFDRKNYIYPDLMKGYQVSQYDLPFCREGYLEIEAEGQRKRIGVTRVHLEEDTARLLHRRNEAGEGYSLVDVNRSGVPLMEVVSEPDLRSPDEARQYLMRLRQVLQYLGVSAGNLEEGNFRCDANVSIRPLGSAQFQTRVEIKNMNSFRAVQQALGYEVGRQVEVLAAGGRIEQETRGWLDEEGRTFSQRSKEYAHDYRYFPEPDLPPLAISSSWVEEVRARMPELPDAKRSRFLEEYGLSEYEVNLLAETRQRADYFEACLAAVAAAGPERLRQRAKAVSNWLLGEMARLQNATGTEIGSVTIKPGDLAALLDLIEEGVITGAAAKTVFEEMFATGKPPRQVVEERGLVQIGSADELAKVVTRVLEGNAKAVEDYLTGKEEALRYLVGQVMRETKGRADPGLAGELLRQELAARQ